MCRVWTTGAKRGACGMTYGHVFVTCPETRQLHRVLHIRGDLFCFCIVVSLNTCGTHDRKRATSCLNHSYDGCCNTFQMNVDTQHPRYLRRLFWLHDVSSRVVVLRLITALVLRISYVLNGALAHALLSVHYICSTCVCPIFDFPGIPAGNPHSRGPKTTE